MTVYLQTLCLFPCRSNFS